MILLGELHLHVLEEMSIGNMEEARGTMNILLDLFKEFWAENHGRATRMIAQKVECTRRQELGLLK